MMLRTLANMASFYTEQQSLDVREGLNRRVHPGLFVGKAPYGYRNVRHYGRSLVEVDSRAAAAVRRAFDLYAFHGHTLDTLIAGLSHYVYLKLVDKREFASGAMVLRYLPRSWLGVRPW